ncbi:MAG TPA: PQQ-binding-like beta-propeller repeat protein [Conexibacter sp.]|nr:PQQ-binding-like beta-propeller repeat protein [Conexibacter sp.]
MSGKLTAMRRAGAAALVACAAFVLLALVMLAGCGAGAEDRTSAPAPSTPRAAAPMRPAHVWGAPNGDPANRRWVDGPIDAASVSRLRVAWTRPLTNGYAATPVVAGDVLYTQDLQSNVVAIDLHSGRTLWTSAFEQPVIGPNGVNVVDGRVFGATHTDAFALDARTGRALWTREIALHTGDTIDMAPGYEDGTVYVSTAVQGPGAVGTLWALDAESGAVRWKWAQVPEGLWGRPDVNAGGGMWHPPAFDGEGHLYAGIANPLPFPGTPEDPWGGSRPGPNRWNNSLVKLDARSGKLLWGRQVLPHDIYDWDLECPPILARVGSRQVVLAAGKMGVVYAFDADGRLLWKRSVGRHNGHDDDNLRALRGQSIDLPEKIWPGNWGGVETQMASDGQTVYVPVVDLWIRYRSQVDWQVQDILAGTGELVAIDIASGRVRWSRRLPHSPYGAATVVNDLVVTTTYDGQVWALDAASGAVAWRSRLPAGSFAPVAVSDDMLITAGNMPLTAGQEPRIVAYRLTGS